MNEISNFSTKVHFRKDSNMSSIIIFALVLLAYTNACLEGKCRCHEELRLIDCTAVSLNSMPHTTSTLDNYTSISLRDNYLKHLNFTSLFKGPGKRGHIVADTMLPMMFLGLRKLGNVCCGLIFCVPDTKFVSPTNVAHAGKPGNICVGNNVSATMCPRLPGP